METRTVVSFKNPLGAPVEIIKQTFSSCRDKPVNRISFVAGLHGDELEGVYLCHRLIETFRTLKETQPEAFWGEIHVCPAVNPQAVAGGSRLWPFFSVDMNRMMGEEQDGALPAESPLALLEDLKASSDYVVDFHGSNLHLEEVPQIRIIEEFDQKLIPLAEMCNVDLIWVHPAAGVFESTLGYNLNRDMIPTLVVEMGICLRIHQQFCEQILQGMLHLLQNLGILKLSQPPTQVKRPLLVNSAQVALVQADCSGLFISRVKLGEWVKKGQILGKVVHPLQGKTLEEKSAPCDGFLFTLREHPLTYEGAPLARIANENEGRDGD